MHTTEAPVITVDGPSGSGKGTLCQLLVHQLGWSLLDSGALYRLVGLAAEQQHVSLDDEAAVAVLALNLNVAFQVTDYNDQHTDETVFQPASVLLDGIDVSAKVRTEHCAVLASKIAVYPTLRDALKTLQRRFAKPPGLVADGRDMGTVIFPDAALKIYLSASAQERAKRRYKQLLAQGQCVTLDALLADIQQRDQRDTQRAVAPLRPASDALVIDSSHLTINEVLAQVIAACRARGLTA
jgi:cytidylate kinase